MKSVLDFGDPEFRAGQGTIPQIILKIHLDCH
jgi:hypothetical protein